MTPPRSLHIKVYWPSPGARLRMSFVRTEFRNSAAPASVTHQGVGASAGRELADVVRENGIQKSRRARAADGDFAHVRDVEDAGGFADGEVFVRDAGVLHRHFPAAEFDEFAAEFLVRDKKWRALQHGLRM